MEHIKKMINLAVLIAMLFVITTKSQLLADSFDEKELGYAYYLENCATCHGVNGMGNGPLSDELIKKPTDLTVLAKENGGSFPETMVYQIIDGRRVILSHGTREMPIWGKRFKTIDGNEQAIDSRISKIIEYIENIQQ